MEKRKRMWGKKKEEEEVDTMLLRAGGRELALCEANLHLNPKFPCY